VTTTAVSSVVLHGHFYQPPREDPWLEDVEQEPSAAPFHDWNERIEQECYRAVVAARRYGADGRIAAIVNTLASMSFDFGPTLFEWLERHAPDTYAAILAADRESVGRYDGHGNAMAMPYHHLILPLASRRDKVSEVRWGIADFRRRYGREPEGMWLPETAVDDETLDVLAAEGIRFTVLAPHQVAGGLADGLPGTYRTSGGRDIALCTYDGPISQGIAFGGLLRDGQVWAERLLEPDATGSRRQVVAVATDGETYGHHHRFGEVTLAWLIHALEARGDVRVENFASLLARHPARHAVSLIAPSSWSCVHGVERWRSDCACRIAPAPAGRPMHWRAPLREALDWLATELHGLYEWEGGALMVDPWAARDGYGERRWDPAGATQFVVEHLRSPDSGSGRVRACELLEIEWGALAMFTSCGWFFDDVSGIETLQVLHYAARAIELAGKEAPRLEAGLLERLAHAESATAGVGTGRDLYLSKVKPKYPAAVRVAAGATAARQLAVPIRAPGVALVREEAGRIIVAHGRTGHEAAFRTLVHQDGAARVAIEVDPAIRLDLDDLPERYRLPITASLRADVIEHRFSPEERVQLATGAEDAPALAARALARAVRSLASDHSADAVSAVFELADLLDLYGLQVPFDAQTAFHRIRSSVSPDVAQALTPVATRLGFTAEG
jgi:alpha-amylase/alpha-mannosidase (GH57 family)